MAASKAQQMTTAQRRAQNLTLRLAGLGWDAIAERLGYSGKAAACKDFTRALDAARSTVKQTADEALEIEMLRLDRLQQAFWRPAMSADPKAGKLVLEIIDRRVKYKDMTGAQRNANNAVDAWVASLAAGGLDVADQQALAMVMPQAEPAQAA